MSTRDVLDYSKGVGPTELVSVGDPSAEIAETANA
jgi:hypothetical protein